MHLTKENLPEVLTPSLIRRNFELNCFAKQSTEGRRFYYVLSREEHTSKTIKTR